MAKPFPEWAKTLYRGVRAGVSAGVASIIALNVGLGGIIEAPQKVGLAVLIAFTSGFLVAFGKWLREWLDEKFGYTANSLPAKIMPI